MANAIFPQLGVSMDTGHDTLTLTAHQENTIQKQRNENKLELIHHLIQDRLALSPSLSSLQDTIEDFNRSAKADQRALLIEKQSNFGDLLETAQDDLQKYQVSKTPRSKKTQIWSKVKSGLERFCKVVYHYSSVMDVLVSAHPEIAALAWGAIKFLLAASVNHQELKEKIVEHLADIGDRFKIVDSYVRLFPETDMVNQVCGVYENFNEFLQLSISWCRENIVGQFKFFKNVALPYEARIKPTIEAMNVYIGKIKERVDVHNTHRLATLQFDFSALIGILDEHKRLQTNSHATIAEMLRGIASDQVKKSDYEKIAPVSRTFAVEDQAAGTSVIPTNSFVQTLPDQQHTLAHAQESAIHSLRLEAKDSYFALDLPNRPEVMLWLNSTSPRLLWIDGFATQGHCNWTTEFSIDVLLKTEQSKSMALFYFGEVVANAKDEDVAGYLSSSKAIVHSFLAQLLRKHAWLPENVAYMQRWTEARDSVQAAWNLLQDLLQAFLAKDEVVYIIIDSIDALCSSSSRLSRMKPFLSRLSSLISSSAGAKGDGPGSGLTFKILITSVTGNAYSLLFPYDTAEAPTSHTLLRIPQTFGQYNVATAPSHIQRPRPKRLVRLPDSDEEFGLKGADSFGFSDDEERDLVFSSDEEAVNNHCIRQTQTQVLQSSANGKHSVRSESSEELEFSENESYETGEAMKSKGGADDIEFSSDEENEL